MSSINGGVLSTQKIVDNGSSATRWDLVLMGDGYVSADIAKYEQDVATIVDAILKTPPFDVLRSAINVHRVNVASVESGAGDLCAGTSRATFFGSTFCASGIPRLLVCDTTEALTVAYEAVPEMNAALLVVNSVTYGGSGGAVPVFSLAPGAFEIALHEMGHSHFGLADEYPYLRDCREPDHARYDGFEPYEPNVTARLDPLKWADVVTPSIAVPTTTNRNCDECDTQPSPVATTAVGAFEGAGYYRCGVYRPQYNCRMRSLGFPFCAVCQQTIRRVLAPFIQSRRRPVRS